MLQNCTRKSYSVCGFATAFVASLFLGCGESDPLRSQSSADILTARQGFVGFVEQWESWAESWPAMIESGEAAAMIEKSRDLKKLAETNPIESIPALRIKELKEAIARLDRELDRRE